MRRWWPLTVRGTGAVVFALGCFIAAGRLGVVELQWFGVLLLALVAGCLVWVSAARRRGEVVRVVAPETPHVGDDVSVRLRVRVVSAAGSPAGTWRDETPAAFEGAASGPFPAIGGGWAGGERIVAVEYRLRAGGRGVHHLGPFRLRLTDPFGIARRLAEWGDASRVVVAPCPVELEPIGAVPGRSGGAHPTPSNRYGQGFDDLVARPWVPGDSMRRIHWRASAHRDELMVRQEEREASPDARVVLDRGVERYAPAASGTPGSDPAFEAAVVAAVSAVTRLSRDGFSVELVDDAGTHLCLPVPAGDESALAAMGVAVADLRARPAGPLTAQASGLTGEVRGPVVIVTGRLDAVGAAALSAGASHSTLPVLLGIDAGQSALDAAEGWCARAVAGADAVAAGWRDAIAVGVDRAPR
ncbi:DUF58 domain-containing protein [Microbacterium sp. GXF7504]